MFCLVSNELILYKIRFVIKLTPEVGVIDIQLSN